MPSNEPKVCDEINRLKEQSTSLHEKLDLLIQLSSERSLVVVQLKDSFEEHIEFEKSKMDQLDSLLLAWNSGVGAVRAFKFAAPIIVALVGLWLWVKTHVTLH